MTRRILTVVAPIRPAHSLKPEHIPCLVAVQPWRAPYPCLSVIVKATASFQGEGAHRQASFVAPRPLSPRTRRPDETLTVVNDMVPNKKSCDLLLTGHVELVPLPSGELLPRHVTVRLGECATSFVVVAGGPGHQIGRAHV